MHKTRTRASFDMITSELSECAKTAADELIMKIGFPCHYHRPLGQFDNSALYHTARRRARGGSGIWIDFEEHEVLFWKMGGGIELLLKPVKGHGQSQPWYCVNSRDSNSKPSQPPFPYTENKRIPPILT